MTQVRLIRVRVHIYVYAHEGMALRMKKNLEIVTIVNAS